MPKKILNLDLDGVVYPFHEVFSSFMKISHNRPGLRVDSIDKWEMWDCWGMTKDEWLGYFRQGIENDVIWTWGEPLINVSDLWKLQEVYDIRIVTSRLAHKWSHKKAITSTVEWLDAWMIPYWNIAFVSAGESKANYVADVAIDDNVDHLMEQNLRNGTIGIVYRRPWNRGRFPLMAAGKDSFYDKLAKAATLKEAEETMDEGAFTASELEQLSLFAGLVEEQRV